MKKEKVFVAGATGAIGLPLCRLLVNEGFEVSGSTRSAQKVDNLSSIGVRPVIVDVYNRDELKNAFTSFRPNYVIHQLTDLPYGLPEEKMEEGKKNNERIRLEGTANLIEACNGMSIKKFIAQSIAFVYVEGRLPHNEEDPLASESIMKFESMVTGFGKTGVVLRYGRFYGPRTGVDSLEGPCRVNVLAAAHACLLVLLNGKSSIYNVTEDNEYASSSRIISETGWDPDWRGISN